MTTIERDMSAQVFTCAPSARLPDVARIMWDKDCGFVPVVKPATGELVGVITDRDICMAAYTKGRPIALIAAEDVMTRQVHSCRPDDELAAVHDLMREHQVRRLPVVDGKRRPVGVLSVNDLAVHALEQDERPALMEVGRTVGEVSRHRLPVSIFPS